MKFRIAMLLCLGALAACGGSNESTEKMLDSNLSGVSHPEPKRSQKQQAPQSVAAGVEKDGELPPVTVELYNESAYQYANGQWMLDVIAGQLAFIDVTLQDKEGIPISGRQLEITSSNNSALVSADQPTDETGAMQFAVRPIQQGEDRIKVVWSGIEEEILLNVIADEALQWKGMDSAEDVVSWETLLGSRVTHLGDAIRIDFSKEVQALDDQEISVIGFVLPLESMGAQQHFLLVSTPPSCFFHLPGGPVGAIEVFADEGIEFDWGPIRLKGRFKLHAPDEYGAVYRLHEAEKEALDS